MKLFRPLPDAFILGAMRAGTTFLHAALQKHPEVAATKRKELQFFSRDWERGREFYEAQMPFRWPRWMYAATGRKWPMVIDSSPYYLFHPEAPQRLVKTVGPKKCIVLLREPGARAWSHYHHMLSLGWEYLGFKQALAEEAERSTFSRDWPELDPAMTGHQLYSYAARGFYADQLRAWWRWVPRENFLLLRSEDLFAEPQRVFDEVCDFLELNRIALPEALPHNARTSSRMPEFIRSYFDDLYAEPNRDLYALTEIGWGEERGVAAKTEMEAACL